MYIIYGGKFISDISPLQMSTELPDSDDSFLEQFYVEDSKSCLELLRAGSASSGQVKEEFKEYTPLVPAIRCIDTDRSSPLMSDSVNNNRFFCPGESLTIRIQQHCKSITLCSSDVTAE